MVGDLVLLETGARVPADGIYLKGNDLRVDESTMTGESHDVYKCEDKPFLCSGTTVTEGDCMFLVTAVGSRSEWGRLMVEMETERDETPLQEKLGVLAEDIGKAGTLVAALCFMAQLINWLYSLGQETCFMPAEGNLKEPVEDCVLGYSGLRDKAACEAKGYLWQTGFTYWNWMHLKHVVLFFIDSVTIIVVAVPEGLPLAVTISLAYSVKKMQADKNLVRVMAACETMGSCTNICSDKTGTLTENVMTVVDGYIAGKTYSNLILPGSPGVARTGSPRVGRPGSPGFEPNKFKLKAAAQKIVTEAIACNTRAEIGFDSRTGKHGEIIGNKTEGALLYFLLLLGFDYRELRENTTVIKAYPFSSLKKRMSTIVQIVQHDVIKRRMYTKGASEVILQMCTSYMDEDGSIKAITPKIRTQFSEQIASMASQGLRTITLAFKDLRDEDDIPSLTSSFPSSPREPTPREARPKEGGEAEQDEEKLTLSSLEENMTMIATFGMKDPLRKGVPEAVRKCQRAGITVRMLTGDSLLTAKEIAMDCGILTRDGTAMEGPDFRKLSEAAQRELLTVRTLPNGHVQTLQVLARCSPQDKVQIVRRLKELGEVVAVTGDGTNDAPALKEADVGLSMGIAGTAVAQEASDIVIMDDNFASIVRSVMWGRSVYDNIRRFLQFQLTVNVVALTICLIGSVTGFGTPLKPVQLLWVNLIMDTFGALALATEDPTPELLTRKPYGRNDKLINGHMWRNIAVQATFQLTVQLSLLWFGVFFITDCTEVEGTESGCVELSGNGQGKNLSGNYRDTVIYNTFVWMQLFNEINCRRIFNEVNMMTGICNNPIFVGIWIFSVVVQVTSVEFFGSGISFVCLSVCSCLSRSVCVFIRGCVYMSVPLPVFLVLQCGNAWTHTFQMFKMAVFHTVPLDFWDWIACIFIASFSLGVCSCA